MDSMTARTGFVMSHLTDELKRLDGDVQVRFVTELDWVGIAMPVIDQACGWTSPHIAYHHPRTPTTAPRRGALFRFCMPAIDATTRWLADVQHTGETYAYTRDGELVPSIDNYARIVADLLIGETLALNHWWPKPPPPEITGQRLHAESELEARHPQALRLLTAIQVRALDAHT